MKQKMIFWIISMLSLISAAHAQTEPQSWPNMIFTGLIFYAITIGLYKWLKKDKIPAAMHIVALVIGFAMALAAATAEFSILNIIIYIGELLWAILQFLISSWVGVAIALGGAFVIFALAKGWIKWIKFGKPFFYILLSLIIFLVAAWYYYQGDITLFQNMPEFNLGGGATGTVKSEGLTPEVVSLMKKYGRNDQCALASVMWQEVGRLRWGQKWSPYAISPAGAAGLMQIIPPTMASEGGVSQSRMYGGVEYIKKYNQRNANPPTLSNKEWSEYKKDYFKDFDKKKTDTIKKAKTEGRSVRAAMVSLDIRFNPEENVRVGAKYLFSLINTHGSLKLAAIMYNGGTRALNLYKQKGDAGLTGGFRETRDYYKDVVKMYNKCKKYKTFDEFLEKELKYNPKSSSAATSTTPKPAPAPANTGNISSGASQFM